MPGRGLLLHFIRCMYFFFYAFKRSEFQYLKKQLGAWRYFINIHCQGTTVELNIQQLNIWTNILEDEYKVNIGIEVSH